MRREAQSERGAVAVIVAMCAILLFGMAAMAVDITQQVNKRQELHDTIDEAVHAGAYDLPATTAEARALSFATGMDSNANPVADFFCIVASVPSGASFAVDVNQIPITCNPGPAPYNVGNYAGLTCNAQICAIPCKHSTGGQCHTIRMTGQKPVPFGFARAIGINQGSTGTVTSVACKGSCGRQASNPLDLVMVGDRTGSMGGAIVDLENAMVGVLGILDPITQHVALGTIGRSQDNGSCFSNPSTDAAKGPWVPVGLSDDYNNPTSKRAVAASCIGNQSSTTNTYLAAPFRAARETLLGTCQNAQLCMPGVQPRAGVKKATVFMTDGEPNENKGDPKWGYP